MACGMNEHRDTGSADTLPRQAQEQLPEQNVLLSKLASQVPGMLYQFLRRPDGTYCVPYSSRAIQQIFGVTPAEVYRDATPIFKAILAEDRETVLNSINCSAQHLSPWDCEYRVKIPGQPIRWMWGRSIPEKQTDGSILWHGYSADITEHKRIEEALQKAEQFAREILDGLSAHVAVVNEQGKIVAVNQAWLDFAAQNGLPGKNVGVGANYFQACEASNGNCTEEAVHFANGLRRIINGDANFFEMEYTCHSPTEQRWFRVRVTPFPHAGSRMVVVAHESITKLKQTEQELRQSEERFRKLFQGHSAVKLIIDPDTGNIIDANEAAASFYGWSVGELKKMRMQQINTLPPEMVKHEMEKTKTLYHAKFEFRHHRADGSVRDVEVFCNTIEIAGKSLLYSIIHDITERKQAEAEKERLEIQNRQLQKSESLGRMAGAIAHHFNNQLAAVMMGLDMAINDLSRKAEPVEDLTAALQSARKAAEVSNLMLIYLGKTHCNHESLDLAEACQRHLTILRISIPPSVILETDLPSPGPLISANMSHIQQVLTNLVTNACEAMLEGHGVIHLAVQTVTPQDIPAEQRFPIDWHPQASAYACIKLADNGCGIAPQDSEKIFDPFFSSKFTGRGLGLAVVLGIVRTHHGVITVESQPNQGSVFQVFFPVTTEAITQKRESAPQSPGRAEGRTILLVEDELAVRNVVAKALMRSGYTVLTAADGVEAVALFQKNQANIQLVLCDLTMPRMNGWMTLEALRKLSPDIPVILSSGYSESQALSGQHPELPQAFLGKPYVLDELRDTIARVLERA
jgi:PAS domain S-box-containing protein